MLLKEEPPDLEVLFNLREKANHSTPLAITPDQNRGVVPFFQLKGEPPDAPSININQGKVLNSQRRMKANLLSLGADCTISRSKFCQGGGYDEDIRITTSQESTRPARAKPPDDHACIRGYENQGAPCATTKTARPNEPGFNIHQQIPHFKKNDRTRTQLDRSYLEIAHRHPTGAIIKPWKLALGESTRAFHFRVNIHSETTYLKDFDRARMHQDRARIKDGQETSPGTKNLRETCSRSCFTRAFSLSSSFHQQMPYLERSGRRITSHDRAKFGVSSHAPYLPYMDRFNSSEVLNQLKINALMFYSTPKKTTCCLRDAKTTANPFSHINQEEDPHLPYLDPSSFNSQRSYFFQFLCVLETLQRLQRFPKTRPFLPKLSRYKLRLHLPYLE